MQTACTVPTIALRHVELPRIHSGSHYFYIIFQMLSSATLEGPHTLISEIQQQHPQSSNPQLLLRQVTIQQVGHWLVKLQLAHYCLSGMYPTWMHRFCGYAFVPGEEGPSYTGRLYHRPTTARLVGLLIGAQAVAAFVHASSSALNRHLTDYGHHEQQTSSSSCHIPRLMRSVAFQKSDQPCSISSSTTKQIILCSICKAERTHPAAPSTCGHVFCWKCLFQWTSAVRAECPMCRSSCRSEDIVALHNYIPTVSLGPLAKDMFAGRRRECTNDQESLYLPLE